MDEIVIIGAGGHAKACIDVIELENKFKIAGLVGKNDLANDPVLSYPIIGIDADLQIIRKSYEFALVAIGHIKSPVPRIKVFKLLKRLEFKMPVFKSPLAYVSNHAIVGEGTIIMHGAIVNAGAQVGSNCIINSKALVEHDAKIADHCHIATGAIVNGEVSVGEGTFIGSGVITKQVISVGKSCVIGAGCVVKQDVPDNKVFKN
jgi:sugar O-acyltransferase (sialic acid O-acetyltransferase NeuD family)